MSTIPIQNLIIDNDTDIGLTSDLINGTYKSSSLTDLSNNVYSKITDLSSNLNTKINTKQNSLTFTSPLINTSNNITIDLSAYDTITLRNNALSSYLLSSTASSTYATITNLNTKQNSLTFSSPLINTSNNITIDLSAYDTIALRNTALGSYLLSPTMQEEEDVIYIAITGSLSQHER